MKLALVMYKGEKRLAISSQDRLLSPASGEATGIPLDVVSVLGSDRHAFRLAELQQAGQLEELPAHGVTFLPPVLNPGKILCVGVTVNPRDLELLSVISMTAIDQIAVTFRIALAFKPALRCGAECLEVAFMPPAEIPLKDFAWRESMGNRPSDFLDQIRSGHFNIQLINIGANSRGYKAREYEITSVATNDELSW